MIFHCQIWLQEGSKNITGLLWGSCCRNRQESSACPRPIWLVLLVDCCFYVGLILILVICISTIHRFFPRILSQNHPFKRYHVYQSCHQGQLSHVKSFPVNHNLSDFSLPISHHFAGLREHLQENPNVSWGKTSQFRMKIFPSTNPATMKITCQLAASCRQADSACAIVQCANQTKWDIKSMYVIYNIYIYLKTLPL